GISREVKNALIAQNLFDEKMIDMETQYKDKLIEVTYKVISKKHGMMFEATISDSGDGFDVQTLKNIVVNADNYNGRGFVIIRKLMDHFYFNVKGNAITIQKFLTLNSELE
ncbi:MAG: ATP-binding protein, partial [Sulfurospirillaceae bacterium]|nr:ATP-binding protein [Sulfurospirillaceae bacterium]